MSIDELAVGSAVRRIEELEKQLATNEVFKVSIPFSFPLLVPHSVALPPSQMKRSLVCTAAIPDVRCWPRASIWSGVITLSSVLYETCLAAIDCACMYLVSNSAGL